MVLGGDHLVGEVAFSREIDISEFVLGVDASFHSLLLASESS